MYLKWHAKITITWYRIKSKVQDDPIYVGRHTAKYIIVTIVSVYPWPYRRDNGHQMCHSQTEQ